MLSSATHCFDYGHLTICLISGSPCPNQAENVCAAGLKFDKSDAFLPEMGKAKDMAFQSFHSFLLSLLLLLPSFR